MQRITGEQSFLLFCYKYGNSITQLTLLILQWSQSLFKVTFNSLSSNDFTTFTFFENIKVKEIHTYFVKSLNYKNIIETS